MGTPKCEVCDEKCNWAEGHIDYDVISLDIHKKCLTKFYVLQKDEINVTKKDLELAKSAFLNFTMYPSDSQINRRNLMFFFDNYLKKFEEDK